MDSSPTSKLRSPISSARSAYGPTSARSKSSKRQSAQDPSGIYQKLIDIRRKKRGSTSTGMSPRDQLRFDGRKPSIQTTI